MSNSEKLPRSMAVAFAVPSIGIMWTQMLFTNYFFKYSVDVLLIAPATIGAILLVTRLWDAVSDPVVGFLTDRTKSRFGRRRPWVMGSAIPVALAGFVMWNPPPNLSDNLLVLWMFFAVLLWETAMTTLFVPYMALASEISMNHHDRTRVAGYRHVFGGVGQVCVIGSVSLLTMSESPREAAFWLLIVGGGIASALKIGGVWRVREQQAHSGRGARKPLDAVRDVLSNPHLLGLVAVYFFEITSVAAIGLLAPFVCQYVIGRPDFYPTLFLVYLVGSYLSTPFVVAASRRVGKQLVWIATMLLQASGFLAMFFAGSGDEAYALGCIALVGLGSASGHVLGMSILADVVDFDEYRSGERKEALHYAAINLARKVSFASVTAGVGVAMEWVGFQPNAEQNAEALMGLSALFAFLPAVALVIAVLLLLPFGLTAAEHARVRAALDERSALAQRDAP